MTRVNPILKARMESIEGIEENVSEEQASGFEAGQELEQSENEVTASEVALDGIDNAVEDLTELKEAQDANVEIMETGKMPEEEPAQEGESSSEESSSEESAPTEENEAVMDAPLPEDEDQAVEVVDEQIQNEELVMESIASSLGFKATFGKSATSQMYAHLGVRTSKVKRGALEARHAKSSKKQHAINAYKSHMEGVGDAIKKLGGAAWDGIKKMIKAVIDFVKTMLSGFGSIVKNAKAIKSKAEAIEKEMGQYELSEEISKGITEITPATLLLDMDKPTTALVNANIVNRTIKGLGSMISTPEKMNNLFEGMSGHVLSFRTAKFKEIGKTAVISSNGIISAGAGGLMVGVECESISLKFSKVDDAVYAILGLGDEISKTASQYASEAKAVMGSLEKAEKALGGLENKESAEDIKKVLKSGLKAAKASTSAPKYCVAAMALALKHIKSKASNKQ